MPITYICDKEFCMKPNRLFSLVLLLCSMLVLVACGGPYTFKGGVVSPPTQAPDFTLTDSSGQPWTLSDQRGKVTLLFFGFTYCPDICPTTLSDFAKVREELGAQADEVQVVFVTVDPERDTPERLQKYVKGYDTTNVALTGTPEELQKVYKAYGVVAQRREMPDSALKYTMDHTGITYAIGPDGKWEVAFTPDMKPDDITSDVRYLLQQQGAA